LADTGSNAADSVWTRRLARGPKFSCLLGWGPGQAIETFWRDVFTTAPRGARLLEIGCGSGDVSVWAAEAGRDLRVVASDIYEGSEGVRQHPGVTFLGGARAEALPVEPESFDMIVSNFAFEYASDREAAAGEVARALRPGGSAILVLHSADSIVTAGSLSAIEVRAALARADIPERVRRAAALRPDHLSRRKLLKDVLKARDGFPMAGFGFSGGEYFDIAERLLKADPAARRGAGPPRRR